MLITPEGRWLDLPHGRRGGGKRATEDQRVPSLLKSGRAIVQGDYFSALPARFPHGESGQEGDPPTVSSEKFRLLELVHTQIGKLHLVHRDGMVLRLAISCSDGPRRAWRGPRDRWKRKV